MPARLHATVLTTCLLFAAGACLALSLWYAAGDPRPSSLAREGRREDALDQRLTATREVLRDKTQVIKELIAGRLTLRQAAERFEELNARLAGGGDEDLIAPFQVASGEEALWRNALLWVENGLRHRRDQAAAEVLARLRAEYRERFGHDPEPWPGAWPQPPARPAGASSAGRSRRRVGLRHHHRFNDQLQPPLAGGPDLGNAVADHQPEQAVVVLPLAPGPHRGRPCKDERGTAGLHAME
jgi:hypothetical protein